LETARRMRAMPGQRAGLPIVALTANVSGLDRADYIAAGMNDLVPKPVEKATLLGAIARHVWAGRRVGPSVPLRVVEPQALPAPRPADALDPARVAAWRTGLPAPVCDALFADCIRQLRDMVPDLRTALTHRDRPSLKRVTHAMMGVAGNYGLAALESAVRLLGTQSPETLNADGEASAIDAEIDRADEAVRTLPQAQAA
jgi:two-component system sensor histidine kinase/response regulator